MKLKILSLLCAFGIFALGTHAMAQDEKAGAPAETGKPGEPANACPDGTSLKAAFEKILCPLTAVVGQPDCKTFCDNISAGKGTPPKTVANCMNFIKSAPGIGTAVATLVSGGCYLSCTGSFPCSSCSDAKTLATCGYICCPIDEKNLTNCMKVGTKKCTDYYPAKGEAGVGKTDIDEI